MKKIAFFSFVALIFFAQFAFVAGFVVSEHSFYFWDHAMYHNMARILWASGYPAFAQSLSQNYNFIFALPSMIGFWLFGDSRVVFILTNFLAFFVLYEIAVSFVLRRIFGFSWGWALLGGFGLCSLVPPLWMPLLDGYPDVGAAACVVFAVGLFLGKDRSFRLAVANGGLLALAVLLRRHYAYPVLALLLTVGGFDFFTLVLKAETGKRKSAFFRFIGFFCLCCFVMLGVIYAIAPDFITNTISTNYISLYASYSRLAWEFLSFASVSFGGLLLSAAFLGLILSRTNPRTVFVIVFSVVCLFLWCMGPCQASRHYMLHVLPLLAIVGMTGLLKFLGHSKKQKVVVAIVFAVVFLSNGAWALWLSSEGTLPNNNGSLKLFSAPRPPETRKDYDELVSLADYLATTTKPKDKIYFVGSSFSFNQDLMRAVFVDAAEKGEVVSRFIWGPEIDGEQEPPFDAFASATVYVVPKPTQYHLDPSGQKVITAAANQFPPSAEKSFLFNKDEKTFSLENGVVVEIWRRNKWTPTALLSTMDKIKSIAGGQRLWVITNAPFQYLATRSEKELTYIFDRYDPEKSSLDALFNHSLSKGNYRISMDVVSEQACQKVKFTLSALSSLGKTLWTGSFSPIFSSGRVFYPFSLDVLKNEPAFLMLHMETNPLNQCTVLLTRLGIESM